MQRLNTILDACVQTQRAHPHGENMSLFSYFKKKTSVNVGGEEDEVPVVVHSRRVIGLPGSSCIIYFAMCAIIAK